MPNRLRKFLVIADETPECRTALYFTAKRAAATGAKVAILAAVAPADFNHWIGVGEAMQREAEHAAEALLESLAEDSEAVTGERPELLLRQGEMRDALAAVLEEDEAMSHLVLGASPSSEGPGPLVSALARGKGLFSGRAVPVTVVPGALSRVEVDALS
jgi:hypothetical protein